MRLDGFMLEMSFINAEGRIGYCTKISYSISIHLSRVPACLFDWVSMTNPKLQIFNVPTQPTKKIITPPECRECPL